MPITSWQGLLQNLGILAILVSVWTQGLDWIEGGPRWRREAFGILLAGGGVILLMVVPFEIRSGLIFDLRGALIALAGFLGSPLIGAAAGMAAAAYRIHLGGAGAAAGVASIVVYMAVGIGAHRLLRGRTANRADLLVFAAVTSLSTLVGFFLLPSELVLPMLAQAGAPVGITSFVAVMLMGLAVVEADRRRETARDNFFYRGIIDALPEPLNAKDLQGRFLAANPATAQQLNAADVTAVIGRTDFDFFPEDTAKGFRADEERVLAAAEPETIEQVLARPDGARTWLSTLKAPLRNPNGEIVGLLTHNRDISRRKLMEDELAESRRRLNDAIEHMADGLALFDKNACLVLCNEQYRNMFPLTSELRVPGARLENILRASVERGEQADVSLGALDGWVAHTVANFTKPGETDIQMSDGRWLRARVRPTADGGSLTLMTDVTQIKHAETVLNEVNHRLWNLAGEDGLTGLANRRSYDMELQRAFAQSRRDGTPLSLLLVDVDHFKAYNDTYGHPAGDNCLRTIGNLLKLTARRPSDVAARYGGEEFAAILPNTPPEGAMRVAEDLRKSVVGLGMAHGGTKFGVVTISIGVSTMAVGSTIERQEDLTASADAALYAAKANGRNRTVFGAAVQKSAAAAARAAWTEPTIH